MQDPRAAVAEGALVGNVGSGALIEPGELAVHDSPRGGESPRSLTGLFTREFTIAEASVLMIAAFVLSATLGAIRQVLFSAQFGTGREANAYYAAARLPDTLFNLIAGGALSTAMIPVLVGTWRREGDEAARRLMNLVLSTMLTVLGLVILLAAIFASPFVSYVLAPGFDQETSLLTVRLTRIMLLEPLILAVGAVSIAVLNSRSQFLLPALSIVSQNFTVIIGILVARLYPQVGIYGPTLGMVSGAFLQVLILVPGLRSRHQSYRFAWDLHDPHLRDVIRLLLPNALSAGVGYAGTILDTAYASNARNPAAIPALHNAWLLAALPVTLLGHAIAQSAFPRLAAQVVGGEWPLLRRTLLRTLGVGMALSIPTLIGLIVFGRPLIRLLFEHGRFDAAAGSLTFMLLATYVAGLPAYVATETVTRGLIALHDTRTPLATNTAQFLGRALLIVVLLPSIGVVAIPAAFAITSLLEALALGVVLAIKIRRMEQGAAP